MSGRNCASNARKPVKARQSWHRPDGPRHGQRVKCNIVREKFREVFRRLGSRRMNDGMPDALARGVAQCGNGHQTARCKRLHHMNHMNRGAAGCKSGMLFALSHLRLPAIKQMERDGYSEPESCRGAFSD